MPAASASSAPAVLRRAEEVLAEGPGHRREWGVWRDGAGRAKRWLGLGLVARWGIQHAIQRGLDPYFWELYAAFQNYLWLCHGTRGAMAWEVTNFVAVVVLTAPRQRVRACCKGRREFSPWVPQWVAETFSRVNKGCVSILSFVFPFSCHFMQRKWAASV